MSKLIANVWVGDRGYGPGYGNADGVPADVAAEIDDPSVWENGEAPAGAVQPKAAPVPVPAEKTPSNESGGTIDVAELDALDDKDAVLEFARAHGIEVDGRKSVANLRTDIAKALTDRS